MSAGKRYACNRLFLSACEVMESNTVVLLDVQGFYSEHAQLECELPCVEWVGGTFFLLPATISPEGHEENFLTWYASVLPLFQPGKKYCLWAIGHSTRTRKSSATVIFRKLG